MQKGTSFPGTLNSKKHLTIIENRKMNELKMTVVLYARYVIKAPITHSVFFSISGNLLLQILSFFYHSSCYTTSECTKPSYPKPKTHDHVVLSFLNHSNIVIIISKLIHTWVELIMQVVNKKLGTAI